MYANFALNFGMFHTDFNCSSDLDRNIHVIQPYKTEIFDQNLTRHNSSWFFIYRLLLLTSIIWLTLPVIQGLGKTGSWGEGQLTPLNLEPWWEIIDISAIFDRCQTNGNYFPTPLYCIISQHNFKGCGENQRGMLHDKTWFLNLTPCWKKMVPERLNLTWLQTVPSTNAYVIIKVTRWWRPSTIYLQHVKFFSFKALLRTLRRHIYDLSVRNLNWKLPWQSVCVFCCSAKVT